MKSLMRNSSTYIVAMLMIASFAARAIYSSITSIDVLFFGILTALLLASVYYYSGLKKTLQYILFVVFLVDFVYTVTEKQEISDTTFFLIFQTNSQEAIDYIVNHPCFLLFLMLNLIFVMSVCLNNVKKKFKLISIIPIILVPAVLPYTTIGKNVAAAVDDLDEMRARREVNLDKLKAENINAKGKTHIFIIGESSNRDYWSLYGFDKETTPFMEKVFSTCKNCTVVRNAYSCDKITEYSLSLALTEANQYDDKKFKTSFSIIDVLNKANVETVWISNQNLWGNEDSSFNSVAKEAHRKYFIQPKKFSYLDERPLDELILEPLRSLGKSSKDRVIFIHLMGSHTPYRDRYSTAFKRFPVVGDNKNSLNDYLNSILYTDYVLNEIFDYYSLHDEVSSIVYVSDHGEIPGVSRDHFHLGIFRIPVFFIFKESSDRATNVIANAKAGKPFTNDLLFDTLLGIVGVSSNVYNAKYDYSSEKYAIETNNILLKSGTVALKENGETIPVSSSLQASKEYIVNSQLDSRVKASFVKGWSDFESWGCWSSDVISDIDINVDREVSNLSLTLKPFVGGGRQAASATIKICGKEYKIRLDFEQKLNFSFEKTKRVTIQFTHDKPESPRDLKLSNDSRKLNMAITTFKMW